MRPVARCTDGIDLVGALRRLIDALRVAGDDTIGVAEQFEEALDVSFCESGSARGRRGVWCHFASMPQRLGETRRVPIDKCLIEGLRVGEIHQQTAEQCAIHTRRDRQKQICVFRRRGAPRVDDDQLGAAAAWRQSCADRAPDDTMPHSSRLGQ